MIRHALAAIAAAFYCSMDISQADAEPIVFIVSYHNLDYAQVACESFQAEAAKTARSFNDSARASWTTQQNKF
jgi:hypothetical protein